MEPSTDTVTDQDTSTTAYTDGLTCLYERRFAEATSAFARALQLRPDDPRSLAALGSAFVELQEYGAAVDCLQRALALDPTELPALNDLVTALSNLGDRTTKRSVLENVLAGSPHRATILFQLAWLLQEDQRWQDAANLLLEVVALAPDFVDAHGHLGYVFERLGRWDLAADNYGRAVDLAPALEGALFSHATALEHVNRASDAESVYLKLVTLPSRSSDAWRRLLSLYLRADDLSRATRACQQLATSRPDYEIELRWLMTAQPRMTPPDDQPAPTAPADELREMPPTAVAEEQALAAAYALTEGPRVSVVTVCKNARRFISRAVASVRAQRYSPVEHVIQDGASTDGTVDEIVRLGAEDKLVSAVDACALDALLTAAERCGGEYCGVCWADDELTVSAMGWAARQFRDTGADVIYGDQLVVDARRDRVFLVRGLPWDVRRVFRHEFVPPFSSSFFRRSTLLQLRSRLTVWDHDEYEFWIWLGLLGRVVYAPGLVSTFHVHEATTWVHADHPSKMAPGRQRAMQSILATPEGGRHLGADADHARTGLALWMTEHSLIQGNVQAALDSFRLALALYNGDERYARVLKGFRSVVGPSARCEYQQLVRLDELYAARAGLSRWS